MSDDIVERLLVRANTLPYPYLQGEGVLDDEVHDRKSREASDINNDGVESQIRYLLDVGLTEGEIAELFDERKSEGEN